MNTGVPLSDLKNKLLSEFSGFEQALNGDANDRHREGVDQFDKLGFPTVKNEEWKYTNISKYIDGTWSQNIHNTPAIKISETTRKAVTDLIDAHKIVFCDGIFSRELSEIKSDDPVMVVSSLSEASRANKNILSQYLGKGLSPETNGLVALNTAFGTEGAFIYIPKNTRPKYPVHLVSIGGIGDQKYINHIRNLIIVEEGASLELIETWVSSGKNEYFNNVVSEIFAGENGVINHYRFQEEDTESARQVNFTRIVQQKHSLVNNFTITTGGKLVRNDLQYRLDDTNCESHLYGLYISSGSQHIDNHTLVDHAMPQCFSNEFYKGIMAGQSAGVFNGKIIVRKNAQKTNAYQSNKNILLSDEAKINTKPQLEIFANDVKCSHGATTGQLDEEAMFYLRSRGIGANEARIMLTSAFAIDVLENIKSEEIKNYARDLVEDKLISLSNNQGIS